MRKILAIVMVGIRQNLADPVYMMFTLFMPIMMTWVMSFLPSEVYEMAILGVLVMFVALNIITSAGGYIIDEKKNGTWQRMLSGTTGHWHILCAYFIRLFVTAKIQALILILSGKFIFNAPWDHGIFSIIVVLSVYIFAMTGLGLFLAGFLKTQGQVQAIAMGIVMIGTMLGGVFFPIDNANVIIRSIAKVSPQSFAALALKDIFTANAPLDNFVTQLIWMLAIGALLLFGGVIKLKTEA